MTAAETLKNVQLQLQERLANASLAVQTSLKNAQSAAVSAVDKLSPNQKKAAVGVAALAAAGAVCGLGASVVSAIARRRRESMLRQFEQDGKVHLVAFPRSPWAPSMSGPCTKVETFLRLARIPYELTEVTSTSGSPNDCVPFMCYNGRRLAESDSIIAFLAAEFRVNLDASLDSKDRATGTALRSLVGYSLFPAYYRIVFVEKPEVAAEVVSQGMHLPKWIVRIALKSLSAGMKKDLKVSFLGAHTTEQFEREFLRAVLAIEQQLGSKPFLFGATPTTYDCAVYSFLVPFANMGQYAELNDTLLAVAQSRTLMDYVARLNELAFPDLVALLATTEAARSALGEEDGESVALDADRDTAVPEAEDAFAREVREVVESDPQATTGPSEHASMEAHAANSIYPTEGVAPNIAVAA